MMVMELRDLKTAAENGRNGIISNAICLAIAWGLFFWLPSSYPEQTYFDFIKVALIFLVSYYLVSDIIGDICRYFEYSKRAKRLIKTNRTKEE